MSGKISCWEDEGGLVCRGEDSLTAELLELRVHEMLGSFDRVAARTPEAPASSLGCDARVVYAHLDGVRPLRDFIETYSLTEMSRERVLEAILDLVGTHAVSLR